MSFPTAVAGPSRLPYLARPVAAASKAAAPVRGYARPAGAAAGNVQPGFDKDGNPVSTSMPELPKGEVPSIGRWLRTAGAQYRTVPDGQKAKWLGDSTVSWPRTLENGKMY